MTEPDPDDIESLLNTAERPFESANVGWAAQLEPSRIQFDGAFWSADSDDDWLIAPLIPRARLTALVAGAKVGKSLLMAIVSASAATGRPILGQRPEAPLRIVYCDLEMTPDDLRERLFDAGYGPEDDLSGLAYYSLPALPPLDTVHGGGALLEIAQAHRADLVVIDTTSRVISGEENSADTFAALYRHAFAPLKAAGIAVVRLDHEGHENKGRARGSSAKSADVDLVWSLTATDDGLKLKRTHQRMSWAPETITLRLHQDPLDFSMVQDSWPAGTAEVARLLDQLGVPLDASKRAAADELRGAGEGRRNDIIAAAIRYRRSEIRGAQ